MAKLTKEQRSAAAKKAALTRKKNRERRERLEKRRKRSQAAKRGWATRKAKNPRAGRMAALKGWRTRRETMDQRLERRSKEIERLQREKLSDKARIAELERRLDMLENPDDYKSEHAEFLSRFKGSKGYGLTVAVQEIYLDHQEIYDEIHDLYELYETTAG